MHPDVQDHFAPRAIWECASLAPEAVFMCRDLHGKEHRLAVTHQTLALRGHRAAIAEGLGAFYNRVTRAELVYTVELWRQEDVKKRRTMNFWG